ncbi:hypothetical protein D7Z54_23655 [Salibacterium salarium]|uniref:PAP2 superfamily protein n=1 Tax=Salibacterium salarium TaxID=284579 RepID=A0A3R9QI65_9BACI|nr:phosphatase PAP2 family protein [Salibacterium salarium]RSL30961.1 hypothetical protein D7Z54_23655 [Salibacterium salarium]
MDWAGGVIQLLGSDWLFLLVIAILYWTVDKHIGMKLLVIVTLSVYVHGLIRYTFSPLPAGSTFTFTFPAREVQAATSFLGFLIPEVSKKRFTLFSSGVIFLIAGITLVHGAHSLHDVIMAVMIGGFIVYAVYRSMDWIGSVPEPYIFSFSLVLPSSLLLLFPEGAQYAGFLLGGGIGYSFEKIKTRVSLSSHMQNKIITAVIGLAGLLIIAYAQTWLPSTTLFHFIHASLLGVWITFIHPLLSIRLGLNQQEEHSFVK